MVLIDRRFDDGSAEHGESSIVPGVIAECPRPVNGSAMLGICTLKDARLI
jgi:hypothetical protein